MQKIIPFLWFEDKAEDAVKFYVSLFPKSKIGGSADYDEQGAKVSGRKAGSVMTIHFRLAGQKFLALNGGPYFKFTPAVSFFVACDTEEEINKLYAKLSDGGKELMAFGKYPFAEKYAWINDRYGVSWQLILAKRKQKITPVLMFTGKVYGQAEEAMKFYTHLFKGRGEEAEIKNIAYYTGEGKDAKDKVVHGLFSLSGQEFVTMDSGEAHNFGFTPAVSFLIDCVNQEEINYFWDRISISGKGGQCGWAEDKFGISWQVTPNVLGKLLSDPDKTKVARVMRAMLQMKKLDIEELKKAYANVI